MFLSVDLKFRTPGESVQQQQQLCWFLSLRGKLITKYSAALLSVVPSNVKAHYSLCPLCVLSKAYRPSFSLKLLEKERNTWWEVRSNRDTDVVAFWHGDFVVAREKGRFEDRLYTILLRNLERRESARALVRDAALCAGDVIRALADAGFSG